MEAINDIVGEMSGLAGGFAAAFDRARTRVERFNAMIQGANAALARMASLPAQLTDGRNRASFGFQFSVASANIQNRWSTGAMETARAFQDAWLGAGNAVARAMDAVIAGNERGTLILRQLWNATVESVIGQFSKMVVSWAMNHILMRAISFAFHAAINALGLTSLAQWLGIETAKTTATSVGATTRIGAHAAEAGAGAAAAESGIPVIGPVLALGAMAAMVVAVLALAHGFAA
ncbi:MAG: hypothetical protein KGR98_14465, partial [Verrucomicrobia bacterium]|nr:hypothetical protein [Verrucomicrobiota bacterium]